MMLLGEKRRNLEYRRADVLVYFSLRFMSIAVGFSVFAQDLNAAVYYSIRFQLLLIMVYCSSN